jgi:hypothetical protein
MRKHTIQSILILGLAMGCNGDKADINIEGDEPYECDDQADNDADGDFDCDDSDCWGSPACLGEDDTGSGDDGTLDTGDEGGDDGGTSDEDADSDGYSPSEGDCDDEDGDVNPGETEVCNDIDDDCNGLVDDDPSDGSIYYEDWDSDGYGDPDYPASYCDEDDAAADSYIDNDEDCNDVDGDIYPGAPETSDDGQDSNCDGYDLNLESCVAESVEDALNYVSYWSYSVSSTSDSAAWGLVTWYIWDQILYVDGNSTATESKSDMMEFDVSLDTDMAMNDYYDPYYLEVDLFGEPEYCYGWIDWVSLPFKGDVELMIDGSNVTAYANLEAAATITDSDITLESFYGGSCELEILDAVLDYGGYTGFLDFQEETANSVADALASELENEIEWYVDYNCTE